MAGKFLVDQGQDDEEFGSSNGCFGFLCFRSGSLGDRTGYTSLMHDDDTANVGCWEGGCGRAKRVFSQSIARLRWREVLNKLQARRRRDHITMKRRKAGFTYDSRSYRLNFDGDVADSIPPAADAAAILKTQR